MLQCVYTWLILCLHVALRSFWTHGNSILPTKPLNPGANTAAGVAPADDAEWKREMEEYSLTAPRKLVRSTSCLYKVIQDFNLSATDGTRPAAAGEYRTERVQSKE